MFSAPAQAYRPFDQTDADVAAFREIELELGPVALVHARAADALLPNFVFNFGFAPRLELVIEGQGGARLGALPAQVSRWGLETAVLVKGVLREGSLQEKTGLSVAMEGGALLPALPPTGGAGASLALIVSQRWPAMTIHMNLLAEWARERYVDVVVGAIFEGPSTWRVRPVGEFFYERMGPVGAAASILAGAIWQVQDTLSFDAAARAAATPAGGVFEARLGLTWAFAV